MSNRDISGFQTGAWLFTGLSAPLSMMAAGCDWAYVLATGTICGLVSWGVCRRVSGIQFGKGYLIAQLIWLTAIIGLFTRWVDEGWPMGESYPIVPITLTILGALSASKGSENASAIGGVLIRVIVILYTVLFFMGTEGWSVVNTKPIYRNDNRLILFFLVTALMIYLPGKLKNQPGVLIIAMGVFALAMCVMVTGGISTEVAAGEMNPYHEWVRGLESSGIGKRFETVASAGLTLGWFCLLSYLLCVVASIGERTIPGKGNFLLWGSVIISFVSTLLDVSVSVNTAVTGSIIMWIAIPCIAAWKKK